MAKSINTSDADIYIQVRSGNSDKKLIMVKFGDGVCWQEVILPASIVKEKFLDSNFWKYILNFFIKDQ